ncbi:MAG: hypothetical protein AUH85_14895 [Chloroflexi bacterium 13_1_40CM_4_68_4]|nr:MAG: hypothetical protein AUH85_14895 [Chloroflexi bacterium 13_1_40CM_4_68_4]
MSADEALLAAMVDALVQKGILRSTEVEAAFRAVPRHLFLPGFASEEVYQGGAIPTHRDAHGNPTSSSSEPGVMAVMLEQLRPAAGQRWLEVGAGTGYNAAIIATLVGSRGRVTSLELQEDVAGEAREHLRAAGLADVAVLSGDGWFGAPDGAPFDRIEVTASVRDLSPHWVEQLASDGLLLVPLVLRGGAQALVAFLKEGDHLVSDSVRGGGFMPMRGAHNGFEGRVSFMVDGWTVTPASVDLHLGSFVELFRAVPREEPAPAIPPSAGPCLALEDPRAVSMGFGSGSGYRWRFGIYDEAAASLALLEDGRLLRYGGPDAADRLRSWAAGARGIEALGLEAIPSDRAVPNGPGVLRRHHYTFVLAGAR